MSKSIDIEVNLELNTVKVTLTERDAWGRIRPRRTRRHTVTRWEFERALRDASFVVPWANVTRD